MKHLKLGAAMVAVVLAAAVAMMLISPPAWATALTTDRDTSARAGDLIVIGVKTNTIVYAGSMVGIDSTGYAVPASDASGMIVIGRAELRVDNRVNAENAGTSGALSVLVRRGTFGWVNGDTVTDANIGDFAYVLDDQTVSATNSGSNAIIAGVIVDYDGTLVWVDTYNIDRVTGSFTTLAASGATALSSTLAVAGNSTLGGASVAVTNNLTVGGTAAITGTMGVTGASTLGALTTSGATKLGGGTVLVTNHAVVAGTLVVTGAVTGVSTILSPTAAMGGTALRLYTNGVNMGGFQIITGTNLVLITADGGVTNSLDADILH